MLRCAPGSVAKGQRLLCYQYKAYLSSEAWGGGGGLFVHVFEPWGLVDPVVQSLWNCF